MLWYNQWETSDINDKWHKKHDKNSKMNKTVKNIELALY